MQDYLLLSEVAQIARTSVDSVRGWVRSGRLRHQVLARALR